MSNNWILDVLADLKSFALRNELLSLAEQLDDTTLVAATEIAAKEGGASQAPQGEPTERGSIHRRVASGKNA